MCRYGSFHRSAVVVQRPKSKLKALLISSTDSHAVALFVSGLNWCELPSLDFLSQISHRRCASFFPKKSKTRYIQYDVMAAVDCRRLCLYRIYEYCLPKLENTACRPNGPGPSTIWPTHIMLLASGAPLKLTMLFVSHIMLSLPTLPNFSTPPAP
jgi:hypothetical protein